MKNIFRWRQLGIVLSGFLLVLSCRKVNEATTLGDDLIPAVDNVNTFETFLEVETDNFLLGDSTRIGRNDEMAIGMLDDPNFGNTKAEAYFTISSPLYNTYPFRVRNTDSLKIDSVVFTTAFTEIYGDTNSVQSFQIVEIAQTEDFDSTGLHYPVSHPDFAVAGSLSPVTPIDFKTLNDAKRIVRKKDTDTITIESQLRIPLFNSVADRFRNYDTLPGNNAFKNDSLFRTFFKGMGIKSLGGDNRALAYIDLSNAEKTGLEFYCRIYQMGKWDTVIIKFRVINSIAANLVKRTALAPEFASNLSASGPPAVNREKLYIQSSPGSYATIRIKGLDTMTNKVLHRVELQIKELTGNNEETFSEPRLLFLDAIDSSRNVPRTIPFDFIFNQGSYNFQTFGGLFRNKSTFFNITRYAQHIITNDTTLHTLRLYAPFETNPWFSILGGAPYNPYSPFFPSLIVNTPIAYGRVIVGGGAHPDPAKRMRVRVVYSKI